MQPKSRGLWNLVMITGMCLPQAHLLLEKLKQRLVNTWADVKQSVVDKAIEQWHQRLQACVRAEGQHFGHL